jgi:ribonuclease HI
MAGKAVIDSSKPQEAKFYAVAVGRVPGVYEEWESAQEQIKEVKGPKYKKFATRKEAEEFVRTGGKGSTKPATTNKNSGQEPSAKKVKTSSDTSSKSKALRVYTDGSSLKNGQVGALAGVGVFFGDNDKRYASMQGIISLPGLD